ncbi:MAG TPA: hypothetical protein DCR50_22535, partial [Afipia sp.]|nr:hypothetical protein [Afipia sp.]
VVGGAAGGAPSPPPPPCHVYIDESHSGVLAPPQPEELELLSSVAAIRKPTSRLSCQLKLPPSITALTVHIPGAQS